MANRKNGCVSETQIHHYHYHYYDYGLPLLGFMVMSVGTMGPTQFIGGQKEQGDARKQNRSQREFDVTCT